MSAFTRAARLQNKIAALEAAGKGQGVEATLARQALADIQELLGPAESAVQEVLGDVSGDGGGKVTESAPKAPKPPKASKPVKPADEAKLTDAVAVTPPAPAE